MDREYEVLINTAIFFYFGMNLGVFYNTAQNLRDKRSSEIETMLNDNPTKLERAVRFMTIPGRQVAYKFFGKE